MNIKESDDLQTGFLSYNPISQMVFFLSVLSITVFIMHPAILLISLIAASVFTLEHSGIRGYISSIRFSLVVSVMVVLVNPLISHQGVTIIGYLPDGNPFTLESVFFGIAAAFLMSSSIKWFFCINRIFNSEKMIYIFGKITPRLALLLSMTLHFGERAGRHLKSIRSARYPIYSCSERLSLADRVRSGIRILSSLIQWSLENSIDTADSMKSRGYGLSKRTFSNSYHIGSRDVALILIIIAGDAFIFYSFLSEKLYYSFYPVIDMRPEDPAGIASLFVFIIILIIPLLIDLSEVIKWKYFRSGI